MDTRLRVTSALVAAIGVLAGCTTNPSTGRRQLIVLSQQDAAALGEAAAPELVQQYGGEVGSAPLRGYVARVGNGLAGRTEPEFRGTSWTFTVLDSDVVNAFALPGGRVFITRGLLERFENEAQVAAVLGHEIGHVTGRHVDEQISQTLVAQGILTGLGAATDSDWAVVAGSLFATGYLLHFGRSQEREADSQGVKYMTAAGYDPRGMIQVLRILEAASAGSGVPEILSTHPDPRDRMARVRELLEGPYAATVNNPAYDRYRARFQKEAAPYLRRDATRAPAPGPTWCGVCLARVALVPETSRTAGPG